MNIKIEMYATSLAEIVFSKKIKSLNKSGLFIRIIIFIGIKNTNTLKNSFVVLKKTLV